MKKYIVSFCMTVMSMFLVYQGMNGRSAQQIKKMNRSSVRTHAEANDAEVTALDLAMPGESQMTDKQLNNEENEIHVFDIEAKRKAVIKLVEDGIQYFKKNRLEDVLNKFSHTKEFVRGELYLFVFDEKGNNLAHGQQSELIWRNLYDLKDSYGAPIVQAIINKAQKGGGWVTYKWRNSTKVSYVQEVKKNGESYIIGSGYYPHSKAASVVNLVKGAVALFNEEVLVKGESQGLVFSDLSYPLGRFILGDLYLYALDVKGNYVAQGDQPGLIGTSGWDYRDAKGRYIHREIITKLKDTPPGEGIWIEEYIDKNAPKKTYVQKVVDAKDKEYFIACGYYPDADRDAAENLVRRGYQSLKTQGIHLAAEAFTSRRTDTYRYGDLYLFVYNFNGKCIAHGRNPAYVGKNQYNMQDEDGRYIVREMIQKAQQEERGWLNFKFKHSFKSVYVEQVELALKKYVIGASLYPISKYETMELLARSAASYLRDYTPIEAFGAFVKKEGNFIRGDLDIFAFDTTGICLAYGDNYDLIWRNLFNIKDDDGKPFVKLFINTVKRGPGTVTYKLNGVHKVAHVEQVDKDGKSYVVGSSFYK